MVDGKERSLMLARVGLQRPPRPRFQRYRSRRSSCPRPNGRSHLRPLLNSTRHRRSQHDHEKHRARNTHGCVCTSCCVGRELCGSGRLYARSGFWQDICPEQGIDTGAGYLFQDYYWRSYHCGFDYDYVCYD